MMFFMIWKLPGKMQLTFFLPLAITFFQHQLFFITNTFFDFKNEIFHKLVIQTEVWVYDGE